MSLSTEVILFTNMLNNVGLRLYSCFTPTKELKNRVVPPSSLSEYLTDGYIPTRYMICILNKSL